MATQESKTVKSEINEVMDERIIKLNELKSVKMANLSKGKRPAAKEAKELATYILNNWDNEFELAKVLNGEINNDDLKGILASRLENFADAKEACKKAVEQAEAPKKEKKAKVTKTQKDLIDKATKSKKAVVEVQKGAGKSATAKKAQPKADEKTEEVKLTKNELEVLQAMVVNARHYGEDDAFVLSEIKLSKARSTSSLSGTMSSLCSKGMVLACNGDTYFDGTITKAGLEAAGVVEEAPKAKKETKKNDKAKSTPKQEVKKEATKPATSTKKVGDIHKNGKWVWTEYAEGKFDWRTIPSLKQKTGAKPKVETEGKKEEKKQTTKKSDKTSKGNAKQTKKGEPKKNSPEAPKMLTIDEFVAMPKNARSNKKPSPAQAEALKLINKGYRITSDQKFFENEEGDKKSCNMDSVIAMFKRYGIEYLPEGLVK